MIEYLGWAVAAIILVTFIAAALVGKPEYEQDNYARTILMQDTDGKIHLLCCHIRPPNTPEEIVEAYENAMYGHDHHLLHQRMSVIGVLMGHVKWEK